jgi:hypothetical protein
LETILGVEAGAIGERGDWKRWLLDEES